MGKTYRRELTDKQRSDKAKRDRKADRTVTPPRKQRPVDYDWCDGVCDD